MPREFVGIILGGCKIVSKVGGGGMGAVYKAIQLNLNAPVALKVMAQAFAEDEGARMMFEREAREVAKLRAQTPNVVQIYDFGLDPEHGLYYITMELVVGEGLNSLLKRVGKLPEGDAARVARQAAAGLDCARQYDMVHRDIKPDNILISQTGVVKITDFGLAKSVSSTGLSVTAGRMLGTPAYMAPEQADAADVDHRTDLYSLGATLYTMLTGALPYKADTPVAMAMQHIRAPVPDPSALVNDLSPQMSTLVQRMMAKRPEDRPQTAAEVAKSLDAIIAGGSATVGPNSDQVSQNTLMMVEVAGDGEGTGSSVNILDEVPDSVRLTPTPATPPPPLTSTEPTLSPEDAERVEAEKAAGSKKSPVLLVVILVLLLGGGIGAGAFFMGRGGGNDPPGPGPAPGASPGTGPKTPVNVSLVVDEPKPDSVHKPGEIKVKGAVKGPSTGTWVQINGDPARLGGGRFASRVVLDEGKHVISVEAGHDDAAENKSKKIPVIVDGSKPNIMLAAPARGFTTRQGEVAVSGTVTDVTAVSVWVNDADTPVDADGAFRASVQLQEGANRIVVKATDAAGFEASVERRVSRDTQPPSIQLDAPPPAKRIGLPAEHRLNGSLDPGTRTLTVNGREVRVMADGRFSVALALSRGDNAFKLVATDAAGNTASSEMTIFWQRWPDGLIGTSDPKLARWPADGASMVEVRVGRGVVYIDRDEVTVAQFTQFLAAVAQLPEAERKKWDHPKQPKLKRRTGHRPKYWSRPFRMPDTRPVVGVDWWDAWAYANWAGKRLPTETEWEAAAGGPSRVFPWGPEPPPDPEHAVFGLRGVRARPAPVGGRDKGAAPSGARDMAGNVWEWCDGRGSKRQCRGGGYNSQRGTDLQISSRISESPGARRSSIGFRCAWKPE